MNYIEYDKLSKEIKKLNRIYYAKIITSIALIVLAVWLVIFVVHGLWVSPVLVFFGGGGIWFAHSASKEGKQLTVLEPKKREYEKQQAEKKRKNTINL